jgi:hypothetical protein
MKTLRSLLLFFTSVLAAIAAAPWAAGPIRVHAGGQYFQQADGAPFFWLGDTAWLLTQKLNREEVKTYFENRRAKGFNVVQCCVVQFPTDKSFNGSPALIGENITKLKYHARPFAIRSRAIRLLGSRRLRHRHRRGQRDLRRDRASLEPHGAPHAAHGRAGRTVYRRQVAAALPEPPQRHLAQRRLRPRPRERRRLAGHRRDAQTPRPAAPRLLSSFRPHGDLRVVQGCRVAQLPHVHLRPPSLRSGYRGTQIRRRQLALRARSPRRRPQATRARRRTGLRKHPARPAQTRGALLDRRRLAPLRLVVGLRRRGRPCLRRKLRPSGLHRHRSKRPASGAKGFITERLETDGARADAARQANFILLSRPFFGRVNDQSLVAGDEGEKYQRILVTRGKGWTSPPTTTPAATSP